MNMLLLLVSAVILLVIVLAAPSSQTTTDDETDSSANSETDVIATNAQIQLVNQAKSSDPNERLAAVSRIGLLLWNGANSDELAIAEFVSIGVLPVLVNCLKSTDGKLLVQAARALKSIACRKALAVVEAGAEPLLVKLLKSPNLEVCKCTVDVLANISWRSNARESKIVEAGAVPLLVKLLQSPDMDLCESTAWTLKNIAAASDDLALAVAEAGALPPLVKLLQSENMELCKL
uniref:Uncharacterized protein n=1 Tax=Globodera rostochiensis TaxID=31243 RepID=A0A914I3W1_GLORO